MPSVNWLYPETQERNYQRLFLRELRGLTDEFIRRLKAMNLLTKKLRKDDDEPENDNWSDELELEVEILIAWWLARVRETEAQLQTIFAGVSLFNDRQFRAAIRALVGVYLPQSQSLGYAPGELVTPFTDARNIMGATADIERIEKYIEATRKNFVASGTTALNRMGQNFIATSVKELRRSVTQKEAINDIVTAIRNRATAMENQALLTGRGEVAQLDGELTMRRQLSVGIADYLWMTRRDERVRPAHRALDGTRQRWDTPTSEGHPGQAYLCRCRAIPIK
ncbi:MAG: hypothetical protein JWR85_4189 [Marmoricola sp.]|nr:hypothetical protein [Marmoricola sp.]